MADCSYNCIALGSYDSSLDNCADFRKGGASSMLMLACGITMSDPSDETEAQALIDAGDAWLLTSLKIGMPAPTPETVAPITSCGTDRVVNNVYTVNVTDYKVSETNTEFWNQLANGYKIGGIILRICDTPGLADMQIVADAETSFSGGLVLPDTNADLIRYEMVATFKSTALTTPAANPIFD